jgi:DNA-binding MarR family transcriptional regulator
MMLAGMLDDLPEIMRHLVSSRRLARRDWDLTIAQVRALHAIEERPGFAMSELAAKLGIGLSAATGLVDRLVQRGLVERAADRMDRRVVRVGISPFGRSARQRFRQQSHRRLESALRGLSSRQLQEIKQGLELLRSALAAAAERQEKGIAR